MWEVILMLLVIVMVVGSNTVSKAAMAKGMSNYVFVTYIHAFAIPILIPVAFLYHRKKPSPSIGRSTILRIILLAFLNYSCSIFFFTGIHFSSPTLASAIANLCLAFTFIIALIFRMEILDLSAKSSILKLIGTTVSISGAFIVIFYQGLPIIVFSSPTKPSLHSLVQLQTQSNWVIGGIFLSISCIFISLAYITKTWIARDFRSEVLITLITFCFETVFATIVTYIAENDASAWTLNIDIKLIAVLVGALTLGVLNVVDTWACRVKGPVFVATFKPLEMIIAVIMGVSFLGDVLYLGSVIGGLTIALGFYTLMKGKADEEMLRKGDDNRLSYSIEEESHPLKLPMLHNQSVDV